MARIVRRCPSCGSTAWVSRVGGPKAGREKDPGKKYRCKDCGDTTDHLEESEAETNHDHRKGLPGKLSDPDFNPDLSGGSA